MNEKINLQQLAERLPQDIFGSDTEKRSALVNEIFSIVTDLLATESRVSLPGFGSFVKSDDQAAPLYFESDKAFADIVNAPFAAFSPVTLSPDVTDNMLSEVAAPDYVEDEPAEQQPSEVVADLPAAITTDPEEIQAEQLPIPVVEQIFEEEKPEESQAEQPKPEAATVCEAVIEPEPPVSTFIPPVSPAETAPEKPVEYEAEDEEGQSSRFGVGYFWGLLTGLVVGAILFLIYVMLTTDIGATSSYSLDEAYDTEMTE